MLVSAALHVLAGGTVVHLGRMAVALAVAWAGAYLLGGRPRGMNVLLGACFAAEYGMHHLFGGTLPSVMAQNPHGHAGGLGIGLGMLLVHAVAAVGSAWWLSRGESGLAMLLHLAVAVLAGFWVALLVVAGVPAVARHAVAWAAPVWRRRSPFAACVSRRGPPLSFSVS
ncbi:hypothetical protein SAMN05444920_12259 [Nonomuraea solani]|uniref:Uncharacterized protein n=1 Tax=Nonomuraea solani TaxID=1144553 RepID=A0A1H6EVG0_9ACTN|nr:hypothetical protein SAMN05444920_12259 [Nonomuraea solani]